MVSGYLVLLGQAAEVLAGLCIYSLAAVLIHELGHAVMALLLGFEILAVRVGPTDLLWKKKWSWALSSGRWDVGFVRAQFRTVPSQWAALRFFAFVLGGPFINICVAFLLAPFSSGATFVGRVCGYLMIASILVGIANLVPFKSKKGVSDGAKLLWIIFWRKKRDDLIFALSLKARVAEIVELARGREFRQAIDKIDRLKAQFLELPGVNPEALLHLLKMRGAFERALEATDAPTSEAQVKS